MKRLLTIGHSYCVGLNRRLAWALAETAGPEWEVHVAAPDRFPGDLSWIETQAEAGEPFKLHKLGVRFGKRIHFMHYGSGAKELFKQPWDLVHAWEEPYILVGSQLARLTQPGTPLVFSSFQNIAKNYPPPFAQLERYAMGKAAGWIGFGERVMTALLQKPVYADKPHVCIPPGVDLSAFQPIAHSRTAIRMTLGWNDDGPPIVGYLGRFVPEKGIRELVQRLASVKAPWRLLLVGGGPMESELRELAEKSGDKIKVLTGVSHHQVPAVLNAMDLLCAPSLTTPSWREQFGRMLVEAFACGIPVIASDSGEIPHVVAEAGIVAGERDEAAWHRALESVLGDAAVRAGLSARGLRRAHDVYAWPQIGRQHWAFFNRLLASRSV